MSLLIDEFENGLHYIVQEPLWQMIFTVAQQLNVQVFATTHSEDCLRSFAEVLKDNGHSKLGQVISLAKVKDCIHYSTYGSRDLEEVFEKEMEVR
jgi:AAA15 family ATPase/GTPase